MLDPDGWEASFSGFDGLMLLEEWMIAAVARFRGSNLEFLFSSIEEYYTQQDNVGFVHLWSSHKRNADKLKNVFDKFERCSNGYRC